MIFTLRTLYDCDLQELTGAEVMRYDNTCDTYLEPIEVGVADGMAVDDNGTIIDFGSDTETVYSFDGETYTVAVGGEVVG